MMTLSSKGYFGVQDCLVNILPCPASEAVNKNRTGLVDDLINVDMKKLIDQRL